MSSIVIAGNTSGSTTLQPTDAVTATITLPSTTSTLATVAQIQGPAFSAYQSTLQSVGNGVNTKIQFQTVSYDTSSPVAYDTTNYRFLPKVAGYYQVTGSVGWASGVATRNLIMIWKNGSESLRLQDTAATTYCISGSAFIYLNGSTDYIEIYTYQGSGGAQNTTASSVQTYFSACLVRTA